MDQILQLFQQKRCVAYGAGNALRGLLAVQRLPFAYAVDDTPGLAGKQVVGLDIHTSARLLGENPAELMVFICANTSAGVLAIARKLTALGLSPGIHFHDCSHLQVLTMAPRLLQAFGFTPDSARLDRVRGLSLALRPRNLSTIAGSWLFLELIEALPPSPLGAIAECGVYQGANALITAGISPRLSQRPYYLYDSFEGLAEFSVADPSCRNGEFADVDLPEVQTLFACFRNVKVVRGRFDQTMPNQPKEPHGLVYVDCDLRDPTRYCCDYFWDQLVPGGYMLVHDYWFPTASAADNCPAPFTGVREALDAFCDEKQLQLTVFPETSHAVFRKPLK